MLKLKVLFISIVIGGSIYADAPFRYNIHPEMYLNGQLHQWAIVDIDGDGVLDGNFMRYAVDPPEDWLYWIPACAACPVLQMSGQMSENEQTNNIGIDQISKDYTVNNSTHNLNIEGNDGKPRVASQEEISLFEQKFDAMKKSGLQEQNRFESKGFYIKDGLAIYDIDGTNTSIDHFSAKIIDLNGEIIGNASIEGNSLIYPIESLESGRYIYSVFYNNNPVASFKLHKGN
jgi:hypothetical protein